MNTVNTGDEPNLAALDSNVPAAITWLVDRRVDGDVLDRFAQIADDGHQVGRLITQFELAGACVFKALADSRLQSEVRQAGFRATLDVVGGLLSSNVGIAADGPEDWDLRPTWPGFRGRLQYTWRRGDAACRDVAGAFSAWLDPYRPPPESWPARNWTLIGVLLTAVVSSLVVAQHYLPALVVLAVRVLGSSINGGPIVTDSSVPSIGRLKTVRTRTMWQELNACLASHLCDTWVIWSFAYLLGRLGEPGWAHAGYAAAALALFGTLARVAAERKGALVTRSVMERIVRTGSVAVALAAAALPLTSKVPALVVPVLCYMAYGLVELVRVRGVVAMEDAPQTAITLATQPDGRTHIDACWADPEPDRPRIVAVS